MGEAKEEEDWPSTCEARAGAAVQAQSYALNNAAPKYSGVSGVSLISTRSAGFATAHLSNFFRGMYLLHDVLTNLDSSLPELNMADSILIEAAPVYQAGFDTHMLQLVRKSAKHGQRHNSHDLSQSTKEVKQSVVGSPLESEPGRSVQVCTNVHL